MKMSFIKNSDKYVSLKIKIIEMIIKNNSIYLFMIKNKIPFTQSIMDKNY